MSGVVIRDRRINAFNETYTIDPWGNLKESGNFNFTQNFNANNQISASGYSYDAAGDLTADGLGNTYTYNVNGMLTASGGVQYLYDALNQRVDKVGGTNRGDTIYFDGRPIALYSTSSDTWTDLLWAGNMMFAEAQGANTISYRLLNHLGSLAMTTDGSGNVTGSNLMTPYGETLSSNTSDSFQFAGLYQDPEYGGDHAMFRNYSTEQTRWTRPDPYNGSYDLANPQSFNRYMYVNGNPLMYTDPSGLCGPYDLCVDVWATYLAPEIGPVGAVVDGLLGLFQLGEVLGWWGGPPQFTGNVQASQSRKNVPQNNGTPNQNCLTKAIQQAYPNAQVQPGTQAVGGHLEQPFTISQQDLANPNGLTAFGDNGYRGSQVFDSLHVNAAGSESLGSPCTNGTCLLQGHFDVLNPATGLFGLVGHTVVDLTYGQFIELLYKLGILNKPNLLDPACVE